MCLSHFTALATFVTTWPVIIRIFLNCLPLPPSYQLDVIICVNPTIVTSSSTWFVIMSIPPLYPRQLLTNLTCYHMSLSHLSTLTYQSDQSPYVSITTLYLCHLRINLICHHTCPTYLPLPPSYQLHQSPYVSIPHIYPCHILINLICHYIWLSHISTLDTFLSTWSVIICVYSTSLPLSPSFNLICHQMCLSHIYTLSTLLSTWPVIIMCLSHISTLFTSLSIWSVIICVYPTSLTLSSPDQFDLSSFTDIPISTFALFLSTCHSHILYIWYHTYLSLVCSSTLQFKLIILSLFFIHLDWSPPRM